MPARLTISDFAPHLHTAFRLETPSAMELKLVQVTDRSNEQVEQFSLLFEGPVSPRLPQGTYTLLHSAMEGLALFLVPLGTQDGHAIYEAIFARLKTSALPMQAANEIITVQP